MYPHTTLFRYTDLMGESPELSDAELTASLKAMGLAAADESPVYTTLTGGVSSDVWRADLRRGPVCIKRVVPKLRVRDDWFVPVERWIYEVRWFQTAGAIVPRTVPEILAVDHERHFFAMSWLEPEHYKLWKSELRDGRADPGMAAGVGHAIGAIHSGTAGKAEVEAAFDTDKIFHAVRLEPYLETTARRHPDLSDRLLAVVRATATNKRALVHGDVSPKNIMAGPQGPVFLDAECAWYGDPAFDLAFCLNHMLLKCLWNPPTTAKFLACFDALYQAHLKQVDWEPVAQFEGRVAALLPGLFLARVDGKSPAEYITAEEQKARVRRTARPLIATPPARLAAIKDAWAHELSH
jgi:aminoglycoside phosphotransferase (APT) family kinase protein